MGVCVEVSDAETGKLMVPWISRIARPDGVWRTVGRGMGVWGVESGVVWRVIEGIVGPDDAIPVV